MTAELATVGGNATPPKQRRVRGRHIAGVVVAALLIAGGLKLTSPAHLSTKTAPVITPVITTSPTATPSATPTPTVTIHSYGGVCRASHVNVNDPQAFLPDPTCTPGALNPNITQNTVGVTICNHNWSTSSIQPTVGYTTALKIQQVVQYGYTDKRTSSYEEDHLISLELGGSPTDPKNLWPEPGFPNEKDKVENYLHAQVCGGYMTLAEAQHEIATNWYQVYLAMPKR